MVDYPRQNGGVKERDGLHDDEKGKRKEKKGPSIMNAFDGKENGVKWSRFI